MLLNKVDVAPAFDFDFDAYGSTLDDLNPTAPRFEVSATRGQGMDAWCDWLAKEIEAARTPPAKRIPSNELFRFPQNNLTL